MKRIVLDKVHLKIELVTSEEEQAAGMEPTWICTSDTEVGLCLAHKTLREVLTVAYTVIRKLRWHNRGEIIK